MKRLLLASAFGMYGIVLAAPANAQLAARPDWNYSDDVQQPYNESRRVAYDNGYREGVKEGERDSRSRNPFDFRDERTWQRGDKGYHRSFGDSWRYQQSFRSGFEAGYSEGYRRYGGNYGYGGGYGGGYGTRVPGGTYPNTRGNYGYDYPRGGYGYSPAYSNGVNDGYQKGREDARDRDSFDPQRHKWYRSGDHDYRNEYGPRREYENLYRQGFQEGYARGYRELGYRR
jgi:flagellar biosynthesis/type III secretory pathway protein FliH